MARALLFDRKFPSAQALNRVVVREDEDLMLAAGRGDRGAFGVLVQRHQRAIIQFVQPFLGVADRAAAEDLAQDVFLAAWRAAPSFRPRAKVLTWLLRIARNVSLNYRRRRRLRQTTALDARATSGLAGPESERPDARAIDAERTGRVREAISQLPVNQQAAMHLRHFHGLSYVEIADVLDTSLSAVESLLFRARRTLQAALDSENDAGPQVLREPGVE